MKSLEHNGISFRVITLEDCLAIASKLHESGKKWHSHVLSPQGCKHNPFPDCYAIVVEDDSDGIAYIAQGDDTFPEVDKVFVKLLHGDDILDASALVGKDTDSLILDYVARLQGRGIKWHHHMHFPTCVFNPHPGEWSISIESDGAFMSEAFADEPVDVLRGVEVAYFSNLEKKTA